MHDGAYAAVTRRKSSDPVLFLGSDKSQFASGAEIALDGAISPPPPRAPETAPAATSRPAGTGAARGLRAAAAPY